MFIFLILLFIILVLIKDLVKNVEPGYFIVEELIDREEVKNILEMWKYKNYSQIKYYFKNKTIKDKIKKYFGEDYTLIDYTYIIENSAIHTYHRDYTSSKNYNNLKYPSYTMILYLDDSDTGLNIIPGSHKDNYPIYVLDKSKKLKANPGSAIIFDADILHAGSTSIETKRHCIQFKIIHKDDINKLKHLLDYHVLINRPNNKYLYTRYIETAFTRHFPIFLDFFQETIKSSFSENKSHIQKFISSVIFSNKDFYKPIRV